jgi:hypothetical protein
MDTLIRIATRGVMEILGLVPSNPRRNTSNQNLELLPSGNIEATCCSFVTALLPLFRINPGQGATKRQLVAARKSSMPNGDADYNDKALPIVLDSSRN